jgi:hypothetical protein
VESTPAHRAVWDLVGAGESAFSKLKSLMTAQAKPAGVDMSRLIADLDSDSFDVREKAQTALLRAGARASRSVEATLKGAPPLEQRRRLQLILDSIRDQPIPAEQLLASRGVLVLEQIGTPKVWDFLRELAKGDGDSYFTREARFALQRRRVFYPAARSRP